MRIVRKILSILLGIVLLGLCVLALKPDYFFYEIPTEINVVSEAPPIRVVTRPAGLMSNNRIFEAIGTGKAQKSVWIYPAVTEQVVYANFKAGQFVAKGDILIQLDNRDEDLAIQLAEIELQNAEQILRRYRNTVNNGAISLNELESARLSVNAAKVKLDQARLVWSERQILAPFSGVVGIPRVDPGDRVNSSTILTSLDDRSVIDIDFNVPEILAGALTENMTAQITTPAFPEKIFTGTVHAIESRFNPQTRTVQIRVQIENKEDILRPGMSFSIKLEIQGENYPTVPEISLKWGRDGSYIWIIKKQKAKKVMARVVARTNQQVLVDAEIEKQDLIVIEGAQRLRDGREVITTEDSTKENNANDQQTRR